MDIRNEAEGPDEEGLLDEACGGDPPTTSEFSAADKPSMSSPNLSQLERQVQVYLAQCKTSTKEFENLYLAREIKRQHLRTLTYEEVEPYLLDEEKAFLMAHPEHLKVVRKSDEVIANEVKTRMKEQAGQMADSIIKELERLTEAAILKVINSPESQSPDSPRQEPNNV